MPASTTPFADPSPSAPAASPALATEPPAARPAPARRRSPRSQPWPITALPAPEAAAKAEKPARTAKTAKVEKPQAAQKTPKAGKPAKPATKAVAKRAGKPAPTTAKAASAVPSEAASKPRPKEKLVRDSFTMPRSDFALIVQLKERALGFRHAAKKSELLRAGLHALAAMDAAALKALLGSLPALKSGRPRKAG